MSTPVTIVVKSDDPSPSLIGGVEVKIYLANSTALATSGVTDTVGQVAFLLPDGDYDVRFYKLGLSVLPKQPQRITVDVLLGNTFTVTCHLTKMLESIDPFRCRISGYILGPDGLHMREAKLSFIPALDLNVVAGLLVAPQEPMQVSSDDAGFFDFTLIRGLQYAGYIFQVDSFLGFQPLVLDIRVPNLPAMPVVDLLFPLPLRLVFSAPILSLSTADPPNSDILIILSFSDGSMRTSIPPWTSLQINHTDDTVLSATILGGAINITPTKAGTDTITVSRIISKLALWLPSPAFTSGSLAVTIS